ncbi:MAG: phosphonate ABC transporter ATP-binding protein [Deltaproteobacteria bacterium]|jgi:phosphonate transport system ATP-binding protein|nr:phosphonate ABC transporter ATP-binding protein [Deltaproteobacteria bacterium]
MIRIDNLNKTFGKTKALSEVNLHIGSGEMVALIGASGSGKSTLIRHISGLSASDRASGTLMLGGDMVQSQGVISRRIRQIRTGIGVIFQSFNLVDRLSVESNVLLGALGRTSLWRCLLIRFPKSDRELARIAMERVGIVETARRRASTLSGGQKQRAAIARALVQKASVILADEPIASLDPESSRNVMGILQRLNREEGITVVVSLHQVDFAKKFCDRAVALCHGRIRYDGPSTGLCDELLKDIYHSESDEPFVESESEIFNEPPDCDDEFPEGTVYSFSQLN